MEMTNDDGVGGVDYSFECIGNVQVASQHAHPATCVLPGWLLSHTAS